MPNRYDANTRAKAIRLVREHQGDYPTEYAAITAVAGRLGMTPETLRKWIRQAEIDEGKAPGTSTAESARDSSKSSGVFSLVRGPGAGGGGGGSGRCGGFLPCTWLLLVSGRG